MGADLYHREHYFRDSYNDSDLLWRFNLSWWRDVIPMLDAESLLQPAEARRLLDMLDDNVHVFEQNLRELGHEDQQYFRDKRREFTEFVERAIRRGEAINCSL